MRVEFLVDKQAWRMVVADAGNELPKHYRLRFSGGS